MLRVKWVRTVLPITAISLSGILWAITSVSFPTSSTFVENVVMEKSSIVGVPTNKNNLKDLWDWLFGKKKKGGSSRGEFCSISPDPDFLKMWNVRPRFIWRKTDNVKQVEVLPIDSDSEPWRRPVTASEQSVVYEGSPLQPGREYEYRVTYETTYQGQTTPNTKTISFQVVDAAEYQRIEAELAALKNQSATAEERTRQSAHYFAAQDLWSDAMQEVFSVQNPSSTWNYKLDELRTQLCR